MPEPLDDRGKDYDEYLLYRPNPDRPDVWSVQRNSYRNYDQPMTIWFDGTLTEVMNRLQIWTKPKPYPDWYGFVERRYYLVRRAWED